jgi:hypothetical protein
LIILLTQLSTISDPAGATVIIKMDIQGAECKTLTAPGLFSTGHHLPWILMEWGVGVLRPHVCPSLPDLLDLLEGHGYRAVWPASLRAMPRHCLGSPWPEVLWIQTHGEQVTTHPTLKIRCLCVCSFREKKFSMIERFFEKV